MTHTHEELVDIAKQIARDNLDEQTYAHSARVVSPNRNNWRLAVCGWLHDVVEDTEVTLEQLLVAGIPEDCVEAIALLTHDKHEVKYEDYIYRLAPNWLARTTKWHDVADNMNRPPLPGDAHLYLHEKYKKAVDVLFIFELL